MDEMFKEFCDRIAETKKGIVSDSITGEFKRPTMKPSRSILIRQLISPNKSEAEKLDLSTDDGVKNTEECFVKIKRLEEWLTLSGKPTR